MLRKIFVLMFLVMMMHVSNTQAAKKKSRYEQLELFNKILYLIENQYYRDVDTNKLIEGAIKGMMDTLDPHSQFLNAEFFKKMQNDTDGLYGGIGLEVTQKDGVIYVVTPIDDTPAFKAGIKSRDKIVEINHESVLGLTLDEAIDKMKGKGGTKVHLGIIRDDEKEMKHFEVKRQTIKVTPVKSFLVGKNFIFLRLTQFQKRSAKDMVKALKELKKKAKGDIRGIVLDLRSNPGGLLDQAVDVSSIFLKDGVVVSTEARDPNNKDIRYVKKTGFKDLKTPMVVLVNGSSASASEIVAGALQDHARAIVMGATTFGKGSVQTVAQIDDLTGVKLTIAQYMTPKNRKIQAIGIVPDVELDEFDGAYLRDNKKESRYIRERDLRNHLTATIETSEEKKARLKAEKDARRKRRDSLKTSSSKKVEDNIFKKYDPNNDFQVLQAINYLKSYKVFKALKSKDL
jgi:carboxyl-terminal processing protease